MSAASFHNDRDGRGVRPAAHVLGHPSRRLNSSDASVRHSGISVSHGVCPTSRAHSARPGALTCTNPRQAAAVAWVPQRRLHGASCTVWAETGTATGISSALPPAGEVVHRRVDVEDLVRDPVPGRGGQHPTHRHADATVEVVFRTNRI